ncbi:MAG: hypothetical protein ACHBMF_03775 [Chromatiales bacterium]
MEITYGEPSRLHIGDTWAWKKSLSSYSPTAGWVLGYALRGAGVIDIIATAAGSDHVVEIPAAITSGWSHGEYRWQSHVSAGIERHTLDCGILEVLPDLSLIIDPGYDPRSLTKRILDAIQAVIEGRASMDQQSYTIGGRTLERIPIKDLLYFRDRYRADYEAERRHEEGIGTGAPGRNIYVQFSR